MKHARPDYERIQDPSGKIPDDEPVFLLRGQDKWAALTVDYWADMVESAAGDPEIVRLAREQAKRMYAWGCRKQPDLPAPPSPTSDR